ncbi:MAG: hypothetical protein U5K79_23245 [Cyclobacteriaceae bacterium]|nr:hypothetical protein [Cyclobacteriaceae bacterium]
MLNGGDPISAYYISWYHGSSSGMQVVSPPAAFPNVTDSAKVARLAEGTYALVLTNTNTECDNEVLVNVGKISSFPSATVTVTDAAKCAEPFMSSATATVTDAVSATHTFEWRNLNGPVLLPTLPSAGTITR